jgi:4-hydroxy-2-oxoglutarate aldolase
MARPSGILTPIITPFEQTGGVDEAGLRQNVAQWMQTPLTGLVVLGSNGEAAQLDDAEADRVMAVVRDGVPGGRVLVAGTGRESTQATVAATRRAASLGVDAVLVRTPSFFKPQMTTDALVRHYTVVADASPVPVLLYNVTMYTGVNLLPDAVERLAQHANIIGMKESGGDLGQIAECIARTPEGFAMLAGSATTLFPAFCAGCSGAVVAVASLVPELCASLLALVREERLAEARMIQRRILPLARLVGSLHGVPGLKAALNLMGFVGGLPRPPLLPVSSQVVEAIRVQLDALGVPAPQA